MSEQEKITILKAMVGEMDEAVLSAYLKLAGRRVLNIVYPFDDSKEDVPPKYSGNQLAIAAYLINKRGAEGETGHSENGISRSYENADIPDAMIRDIVPMVGVVRGGRL